MKEWLSLRHAQKKFSILACNDTKRLEYILNYDQDDAVKHLIGQRISEIKGE